MYNEIRKERKETLFIPIYSGSEKWAVTPVIILNGAQFHVM